MAMEYNVTSKIKTSQQFYNSKHDFMRWNKINIAIFFSQITYYLY